MSTVRNSAIMFHETRDWYLHIATYIAIRDTVYELMVYHTVRSCVGEVWTRLPFGMFAACTGIVS